MNDYEFAIKQCKQLEALLADRFGATGRGLHEKVSSVEPRLPEPLVRRLRYIATVRNKLVHDTGTDRIEDRDDYRRACVTANAELRALSRSGSRWPWRAIAFALALSVVGLFYVLLKRPEWLPKAGP